MAERYTLEHKAAKKVYDDLKKAERNLLGMRFSATIHLRKLLEVSMWICRENMHPDDEDILF